MSRLVQVVWELAAIAFIALTILGVRKARARGKRLFRDEPMARVRALKHDTTNDHIYDGA